MTVWQPGLPVVCVDDSAWCRTSDAAWTSPPVRGVVYIVDRIGICCATDAIALEEYPPISGRVSWWERRYFRPLRDADLDQFRAHLTAKVWAAPADLVVS